MARLARQLGLDILPGGLDPDDCSDEDICAALAAGVPASWPHLRDTPGPVEFAAEQRWVERTVLPDGRWDLAPPALVDRLADALSRPVHDLLLGNRRERAHVNSTLTWGTASHPPALPYLYLSLADAGKAGVRDGDRVEVSSPHGSVVATARLDEDMSPGTVVIPHGFTEPNVGLLTATDAGLDPLTGMPTLVGVPVTLRVV
jgi:formate dehydrogenase